MIPDRVTIDIDAYVASAGLKAIRAWYALRRHPLVTQVRVHVSTSGEGIHIEGYLERRLADDERRALRRALNDDSMRTDLDRQRGEVGHMTDICWAEKAGNDGEREEVPTVWAALDRIEANTDDYQQVKALALNGRKAVWASTHGVKRPSRAQQ